MSGVQSVLNHLRFARHWLVKAENEFERQESIQGELSLSLVEAEVKKAWTESRRAIRLIPFPLPAERAGHPARLVPGAVIALLVVALGGFGVARLTRPPSPRMSHPPALPGAMPQEIGQVANLALRPVESPPPPVLVGAVAGRLPEDSDQNRISPLPSPSPVTMQPPPAGTVALPASAVPVAAVPPAASPTPVTPPVSPAPNPAVAGEGGGTPLPLDLVELVQIAERSLTGRP